MNGRSERRGAQISTSVFETAARQLSALLLLPLHLAAEVPAVQVPSASAQVRREAEPAQIRDHTPRCRAINSPPQLGQVGIDTHQSDNVSGRLDGALEAEEQRHPGKVEAQLNSVQSCRVLGHADQLWSGRERAETVGDGAVCGVAHEAVQGGPYWAKDVRRWSKGWLLDGEISFLGFFCCLSGSVYCSSPALLMVQRRLTPRAVAHTCPQCNGEDDGSSWVGKNAIWDRDRWNKRGHCV